ncbi:MAG: sensor histidine kinase [Fibrobacterota bacterium]
MSKRTEKPFVSIPLKKQLSILLVAVLAPAVLIIMILSFSWVQSRYSLQIQSNEEVARTLAVFFRRYVRDVIRAESILGRTVLSLAPEDSEVADQLLMTAARTFPSVNSFLLLDTNGVVVAGDPRLRGTDLSGARFFREFQEQDSTYLSNLEIDLLGDKPGYVICTRVAPGPQTPSGIVVGYIDPSVLADIIFVLDRPSRGNFVLYDRDGVLVYSDLHANLDDSSRADFGDDDELLGEAREGRIAAGQVRQFDENSERIAAFVPVEPHGWVVGATEPVWLVYRPILDEIIYSILAIAVTVLIVLWFGFRVIGRISRSVRELQKHARMVGQGNYGHKTHPSGIEEFDILFSDFNSMGEQLQERDKAVKERASELERSNQELEQFAYVASHDLQEPLRTIAGYLQLIERRYKGKLDKDADEFIAFAVNGAHRLGIIINDLLAFSRVGTRGKPFTEFNSGDAVEDVLKSMRATVDGNNARVEKGELPRIKADLNQFRQLVQNLLSNAIKFRHPDRDPLIRIEAARTDGEWRFSFIDNGIGFESQYAERIFIAFKRLHTQDKFPGSGVGLAICRKIVQRHGGRIWAESTPGEGATFHFTIPERNQHVG